MNARPCRNDDKHRPATFGVYCHDCLAALKRERAQQAAAERYWRAIEAGAGDLWRLDGTTGRTSP